MDLLVPVLTVVLVVPAILRESPWLPLVGAFFAVYAIGLLTGGLYGLKEALSTQRRKVMDVLIALSFVATLFLLMTNQALPWPLVGAFFATYLVGLFVGGLHGARAIESSSPS